MTILPGEVEFLPLLKNDPCKMASRKHLASFGVQDWMIDAHERRGEVITTGPGPLDSVTITAHGESCIF